MKTAKPALERTTNTSTAATTATTDTPAPRTPGVSRTGTRFKEVWLVEDRRDGKSMWTRVGTAFENNDGSWNIRLSALPVGSGRLNMRDPEERTEQVAA